jgi:hypothetical protein
MFPSKAFPGSKDYFDQFDQLGGVIFRYLETQPSFGQHLIGYTHFNVYNHLAFTSETAGDAQLHEIKYLSEQNAAALALLSQMKYNLDGKCKYYQRYWCVPLSVVLRFAQAQRQLAQQTHLEGDVVVIEPWPDPVTGRPFPDPGYLTQDLHGQTFYVPDPARVRVRCGDREITSLKRNPPDFTGRPSVTIVDNTTPTVVLDEVPLQDLCPASVRSQATVSQESENGYSGKRALHLEAQAAGAAYVRWVPGALDNHETDYLSFAYRKSNPASRAYQRWTDEEGVSYEAREEALPEIQGWQFFPNPGEGWREVVLDYADMQAPAGRTKSIPRGRITSLEIGLRDCAAGDQLWVDRVAFLSARGVRPTTEARTVVLGGRTFPPRDGLVVELVAEDGRQWQATTANGGWYRVQDVPLDAVIGISCRLPGRQVFPRQGKRIQACRNSLEYHLFLEPEPGH